MSGLPLEERMFLARTNVITYQDLPKDVIPTISHRPSGLSTIRGPPRQTKRRGEAQSKVVSLHLNLLDRYRRLLSVLLHRSVLEHVSHRYCKAICSFRAEEERLVSRMSTVDHRTTSIPSRSPRLRTSAAGNSSRRDRPVGGKSCRSGDRCPGRGSSA